MFVEMVTFISSHTYNTWQFTRDKIWTLPRHIVSSNAGRTTTAKLHVRHNGRSACRWHLLHSYNLNSIITILCHNLMQYNRHPYSGKEDQDVKACPISVHSLKLWHYLWSVINELVNLSHPSLVGEKRDNFKNIKILKRMTYWFSISAWFQASAAV